MSTIAPGYDVSASSRRSIDGRSRWFVGSSSTSNHLGVPSPIASAIFRASPGDGWSECRITAGSAPSSATMERTRPRSASERSISAFNQLRAWGPVVSCARWRTLSLGIDRFSIMASTSEVFPAPFTPAMRMRSPRRTSTPASKSATAPAWTVPSKETRNSLLDGSKSKEMSPPLAFSISRASMSELMRSSELVIENTVWAPVFCPRSCL